MSPLRTQPERRPETAQERADREAAIQAAAERTIAEAQRRGLITRQEADQLARDFGPQEDAMFTKAQIEHDEAMRKGATEARSLTITSHTHLDGARHEGAISECNYDAEAPDPICRYCGTSAEYADAIAHRDCPGDAFSARCESGWTGDRCTFPLYHDGPHSN